MQLLKRATQGRLYHNKIDPIKTLKFIFHNEQVQKVSLIIQLPLLPEEVTQCTLDRRLAGHKMYTRHGDKGNKFCITAKNETSIVQSSQLPVHDDGNRNMTETYLFNDPPREFRDVLDLNSFCLFDRDIIASS
jgi:hypothetical protein